MKRKLFMCLFACIVFVVGGVLIATEQASAFTNDYCAEYKSSGCDDLTCYSTSGNCPPPKPSVKYNSATRTGFQWFACVTTPGVPCNNNQYLICQFVFYESDSMNLCALEVCQQLDFAAGC